MLSSGLILPHERFRFKPFSCSCNYSLFPFVFFFFLFFHFLQLNYIAVVYNITGLYPLGV